MCICNKCAKTRWCTQKQTWCSLLPQSKAERSLSLERPPASVHPPRQHQIRSPHCQHSPRAPEGRGILQEGVSLVQGWVAQLNFGVSLVHCWSCLGPCLRRLRPVKQTYLAVLQLGYIIRLLKIQIVKHKIFLKITIMLQIKSMTKLSSS